VEILPALPGQYHLPVILVQHLHPSQEGLALLVRGCGCALPIKEVEEKEHILRGHIYVAPANYHLLVEDDRTFSLSVDPKVNFTRPAIDVLFESASDAYGSKLAGVILSGANHDGAQGLVIIKQRGGIAIVQDPLDAEYPAMPQAALALLASQELKVDCILSASEIGRALAQI
jgi:two-component system chemotaxis response regulator CheB